MNQKGANNVVQCVQHLLGFAILGRCIGATCPKENVPATKEGGRGNVDELSAIICLKTFDRQDELSVSIVSKLNNMRMNFRFRMKRECPVIMIIIINNHKIIFKARHAEDWRSPDITVNKFKRC